MTKEDFNIQSALLLVICVFCVLSVTFLRLKN